MYVLWLQMVAIGATPGHERHGRQPAAACFYFKVTRSAGATLHASQRLRRPNRPTSSQEATMITRTKLLAAILTICALLLAACGGSPAATLADIPAYPGAAELKPGEDNIANTLANNNQADAALRAQLGTGGKTEQKGFNLPKDAQWDKVKSFYDEKLKASGWGTNSLVGGIMEQANQGNDLFKTANWQKDKQNVTIVMVTSPATPDQKQLIVSLSTQ
jgi:hypothetical protein